MHLHSRGDAQGMADMPGLLRQLETQEVLGPSINCRLFIRCLASALRRAAHHIAYRASVNRSEL